MSISGHSQSRTNRDHLAHLRNRRTKLHGVLLSRPCDSRDLLDSRFGIVCRFENDANHVHARYIARAKNQGVRQGDYDELQAVQSKIARCVRIEFDQRYQYV